MKRLYEILISCLSQAVKVTKVYDTQPSQAAMPYVVIRFTKNVDWGNLLVSGVKSDVICEVYTQDMSVKNMLDIINKIKSAVVNPDFVHNNPEIIYFSFAEYKIKQRNNVLIGIIYFKSLVRCINVLSIC